MSGTYLVTPYAEKDRVKALGARWDAGRRQWYVAFLAVFSQSGR